MLQLQLQKAAKSQTSRAGATAAGHPRPGNCCKINHYLARLEKYIASFITLSHHLKWSMVINTKTQVAVASMIHFNMLITNNEFLMSSERLQHN